MKYFFTTKAPAKLPSIMRKVQSIATALIMSNPFKILDRVIKYTLSDLTFMTMANPKTMFKLNDARKMLSAFIQSKGAVADTQLKQFLNTQGVDLNKTNFDYVLNDVDGYEKKGNIFTKYFDSLGKPFEFQTQLVRFAYWLQTVEDLNAGKTNVYGSAYYKKDMINKMEALEDNKGNELASANEVKAAYLMAQQLGAPGDFPLLAKDLNGIFMFTTFPLALVRWAKGEAFSLATAAKNLFVEGEGKSALSWLATTGGGVMGSALMMQLIISLIANMYNVDEETEKEYLQTKKDYGLTGTFTERQAAKEAAKEANRTGMGMSAVDALATQGSPWSLVLKKARDISRMTPVRTNVGLNVSNIGNEFQNSSQALEGVPPAIWLQMLQNKENNNEK
jgi:hypothetical protein